MQNFTFKNLNVELFKLFLCWISSICPFGQWVTVWGVCTIILNIILQKALPISGHIDVENNKMGVAVLSVQEVVAQFIQYFTI